MNELQKLAGLPRPVIDHGAKEEYGVIYMIYGRKHSAHLIASFMSLRSQWRGRVCFLCGDEQGLEVAEKLIALDKFENSFVQKFERYKRKDYGRGTGYLTKTMMIDLSPFEYTVFLDADTIVTGSLTHMFPEVGGSEVVLTQFADWTTQQRHIRKRLKSWEKSSPNEYTVCASYAMPALNTGVIGFSRLSVKFSKAWQEITKRNVSFICDEIGAQLAFYNHPHRIERDLYNASPIYSWKWLEADVENFEATGEYLTAKIIHGHGNKLVKRPTGQRIYLPFTQDLWDNDTAGFREYAKANKQWKVHYIPVLSGKRKPLQK